MFKQILIFTVLVFSFITFSMDTAAQMPPLVDRELFFGNPEISGAQISPDGKYAVFTISATDMAKNKRVNTLHLLDLTRAGAAPQPVQGATSAHDAVFGRDGALYFLMAVGARDQLFRLVIGGKPVRISDFGADIAGFKLAPSGDRVAVWADRPLACPDLACAAATLPAKPAGTGRT